MGTIPEDVKATANAAAVLIWDEATYDPSPAQGYAMSQAVVERIIGDAILAERERGAALELLAALKAALYAITEIDNAHKSLRQIRAAIAKAEGRTP